MPSLSGEEAYQNRRDEYISHSNLSVGVCSSAVNIVLLRAVSFATTRDLSSHTAFVAFSMRHCRPESFTAGICAPESWRRATYADSISY